jgi:23S rRNA (cytidine2498-2'-O)-methyltransferase
VQPALCASPGRPRTTQREDAELTFARQGLPVQVLGAADAELLAGQIQKISRRTAGKPLALHVFAPDSDAGNLRSAAALALQARLSEVLRAQGATLLPDGRAAHEAGGELAQVCLLSDDQVAVGVLPARSAPSLFPGGRQRVRRAKDAPARSGLKLSEALAWLGHGPQAGEVCVDLGAAPGGWSQVLLDRRCHVVAIDPGRLAPHLQGRLEHLRMNAFSFEPEIPADWVLCDMAYRPLEVAALLAKWGRKRWAQFLLANIKLPMSRRVDMLARVREILQTGGWTGLRMRQLYHDRNEVTLTAWRGFGIDTRVPQRQHANPSPRPPR